MTNASSFLNSHPVARKVLGIVMLAAASYASGRLGLFLAIPPGYATAVWPPAGIALAGVLYLGPWGAFGVLLGSFLVNLGVGGTSPTVLSAAIAASIALGSTLQALLGSYLIRKYLRGSLALDRERDVLRFLLLGGPIACLFACTWGTGTLLVLGNLPFASAWLTAWTWWTGDVLGVLVFTPLALLFLGEPKDLWKRRRLTLGFPLVASFTLMALFFLFVRQREGIRLRGTFETNAQNVANTLRIGLAGYLNHLEATASFFEASQKVDPEEFALFTAGILANHPGIQALEWAPRVTSSERAAFETSAQSALQAPFAIREKDSHGSLVEALPRETYFPVLYALPEARNRPAIGFDLASEGDRREAIEQAMKQRGPFASNPIQLIQDPGQRTGLLILNPVFSSDGTLKGYVVAVFRTEEMLGHMLRQEAKQAEGMRIDLHEEGSKLDPSLVTIQARGGAWFPLPEAQRPSSHLTWKKAFLFAGRTWQVQASQDPVLLGGAYNWESWTVLVAGVMFTGLLGAMLLIVTGRTRLIEGQVKERTAALRKSKAELLRQSRLLSQTQSAAKVGGWEFDLQGGELYWTPETFHLHGLDPSAFHPTMEQAATFLPGPWASLFLAAVDRAIYSGEPIDLEVELHPAVGNPIWVQITGKTESKAGELAKLYGAYQDVTHRRQAEQLKNEFISVVSHELRTPLTALKGAIGLLGDDQGRLEQGQKTNLQRIAMANAERLGELVNDLLEMEKIRSGKLAIDIKKFSPNPVIKAVVMDNEGLGQPKGIRFHLELSESLPDLLADPQRVAQVLTNLLSNASKFSPDGADVYIATTLLDGFFRISVTDHGPGIPEGFRDRIFQPFAQADGSDRRAKGGTGLGLSICKALVEGMGGSIGFESQVGKGCTFWFDLPVAS